jgi:hypothetical protein
MLIDDCSQVTAKRQALDADLELSQTTHRFEALQIQAPAGCEQTMSQIPEHSASGTTVFESATNKPSGTLTDVRMWSR